MNTIVKVTSANKTEWVMPRTGKPAFLVGNWLVIDSNGVVRAAERTRREALAFVGRQA